MPANRQDIREQITEHYEEDERSLPDDGDSFSAERDLPGHASSDFVPWLQLEMLEWVPADIRGKLGTRQMTFSSGDFLEFKAEDEAEINAAFEAAGFEIVADHGYEFY